MLSILTGVLALAAQAYSQFVPFPTDLTTTKGYAGYQVRWKEVPTGICELVNQEVRITPEVNH